MRISPPKWTRRTFLSTGAIASGAAVLMHARNSWAHDSLDPRTSKIVAETIGIDAHNHIDVPLTSGEMPGADIDLMGELKRSGLTAICMTFATDYQPGDAHDRFQKGIASMSRQLERNAIKRSLTANEVRIAHRKSEPTVIQAVEGAHFTQGHIERVEEAYRLGLRHFGLLHDSDATVPLGDVYTNSPKFGGLTVFGASVIKECNRLGMLIDLAHANEETTKKALKIAAKPVVVSHTGLDTQLGSDPRMAQMMRSRLISKAQAKMVADAGGAIGVWTHLADSPLEYAKNVRALVDIIGVGHVIIGTDTKLTPPTPRFGSPPNFGPRPENRLERRPPEDRRSGDGSGPPRPRAGERTNEAWSGETSGFYYVVVDAMLKTGFTTEEIGEIGGGNYLRIFEQSVKQ